LKVLALKVIQFPGPTFILSLSIYGLDLNISRLTSLVHQFSLVLNKMMVSHVVIMT